MMTEGSAVMIFRKKDRSDSINRQIIPEEAEQGKAGNKFAPAGSIKRCKRCGTELPSTAKSDYCEDCRRTHWQKRGIFLTGVAGLFAIGIKHAKFVVKIGKNILKKLS
jgi:predicted nucleic-acid-binding Zn-ribbon protein